MKKRRNLICNVKVKSTFYLHISVMLSVLILFSLNSFCQDQIVQKGSSLKNNFGFIENKGQIYDQNYLPNPAVKYLLSLGNGLNVQLKANSFSYDTYITERVKSNKETPTSKFKDSTEIYDIIYHFHRVDIELVNANPAPQIIAEGPSEDYLNYYNAITPEEGVTFVRSYQKITYKNIYPGIDLEFQAKSGTEKPVEYNFIVHPGSDAFQIRLKYKGAIETSLANGKISVKVAHGSFYESIPKSQLKETNESIEVKYKLTDHNEFGFQIPQYFSEQTLIIDPLPILDWGTYYGGSGGDYGTGIVNDINGNCYVTGGTGSISAIATSGAYQTNIGYYGNAFIVKFNLSGQREWGTYYGGNGGDAGSGISYSNNFIYIIGNTASTSGIATTGTYRTVQSGGVDAFVAKFNTSGQRQWGTYYGGGMDDYGNGIANDKSGNIFVTGYTNSSGGFATTNSHQRNYGGNIDAFIVKFSPTGQRIWGTYYGGKQCDKGNGIATDIYGNCYIIGTTESDSGIVTSGAHQTIFTPDGSGEDHEAFIVKFNWLGQRQWGTYYGDVRTEGNSITTDNSGNIFFAGFTVGGDTLIATPGSFQSVNGSGAFIAKFSSLGHRQWGTFFYGGNNFGANINITTDLVGNILITGITGSNPYIATIGAHQAAFGGGDCDVFVVKFNTSGSRIWGTYYGGNNRDFGYGISSYMNYVFITGSTTSSNSISTSGTHQTNVSDTINGDAFIAKFISCYPTYDTIYTSVCDRYYFNGQFRYLSGTYTDTIINYEECDSIITLYLNILGPRTQFFINHSTQCLSGNIFSFSDSSKVDTGSISYHWYFGDHDSSNLVSPSHSYSQYGTFSVKLITVSDFGCRDSLVKSVIVKPMPVAYFEITDSIQCFRNNLFEFTNKSSVPFGSNTYEWIFGDGQTDTGFSPAHQYMIDDTFVIKLITKSKQNCLDSVSRKAVVYPTPAAFFVINDSSQCLTGNQFNFTNQSAISSGNLRYRWFFGDGDSIQSIHSTHQYKTSDSFSVNLIATSSFSCTDSIQRKVYIHPVPIADFSINDSTQCLNNQNFTITNKSYISSGLFTNTWYIDHDTFTSVNLQFTNLPVSTQTLKLITGTIQGCIDNISKKVYVYPMPKASFTVPDTAQCYLNNSFDFTNTSTISSDTLFSLWDFGDSTYSTSASHIYNYHSTGSFRVKLTVTSPYGCSDSEMKNVIVGPDATISSVTNGSHCGPGQVLLQADALNGNISWYASSVGGALLDTGNLYTTGILSSSSTFYVEAANPGCTSPRNSVQAKIITIPSIISTIPQSRVGLGSVILTAQPSAGSVGWYEVPSGGNKLFSGSTFLTPILTATTTFYAEAQYIGCSSYPRTAVTASLTNSINDRADPVKVTLYPNPTHDYVILSVYGLMEPATLEIRDVRGRLLKIVEIKPSGIDYIEKIDLLSFEQGIYNFILINKRVNKAYRVVKF